VIHTHFWEAIEARLKLVEFRSPRQIIPFFPGMHLLFSLIASERRKGRNELLAAHVLEIVILSRAEAYARFPREAEACNLTGLCNKWGRTTVQCLVLDANSIAVARYIVHLSLAKGSHTLLLRGGRRGFDPRQPRRTKRAFFPPLAI
jgi:hypothetical protein